MSQKWGQVQTYAWAAIEGETVEELARFATAELEGVRAADVLIALLPGGFGTHTEIGAALALGKRVILHSPDEKTLKEPYRCPFHYHPRVEILVSETPDIDAILACLPGPAEDS